MKSFHYILFYLLLALSQTLSAQINTYQSLVQRHPQYSIYPGVYIFEPIWFDHSRMTSESEIDKSRLRITYEVSVVENTKSGRKYKDRMIVLIGDNWYKSYGEGLWKGNKLVALSDYDPDNKLYMREKGYEEILPHAVYRNQKTKTVINRGIFPKLKKIIFRYDEIQPEFKWELSDETKYIEDYLCQKATAEFKGRKWIVWFTPEIPVDCGLWKFSGLPGLILEANDSEDEYNFILGSIEQKEEPILWYNTDKEKKMNREEFRKQEKKMYDDPILNSQGPDGYLSIISDNHNLTGREVFTSGHFVYPYNPMELE